MKTALFRYDAKNGIYKNMGDYVQSIAAMQFLDDEPILLERDHLHEYNGESVKLIMAAWWMHYPKNWPPSSKIKPFFISFHVNPHKAEGMLSEEGVNYLKQYEPIGCRDKGTQRLLESKGIEAYFSGCLTLTLGKTYQHEPLGDKVAFVDPHFDLPKLKEPWSLIKPTATLLINFNTIRRLSSKMYRSISIKSLLKSAAFYRSYSKKFEKSLLLSSDYYTHSAYEPSFKSEQEKFDHTHMLLKAYSNSNFIVTSRLHVSLPTIAMGVPTLFVQSEKIPRSPGRFEGLLEHVNCIEYRNGNWTGLHGFQLPKVITRDYKFSNKDTHIELAQKLSNACEKFIGMK